MQITTPSGYVVTIKDGLTFGERRAITQVFLKDAKVNASTQTLSDISSSVLWEAQDKAVSILVTKIVKGEKEITTDILKEIYDWNEEDANLVYKTIDEITKPKETGEKK